MSERMLDAAGRRRHACCRKTIHAQRLRALIVLIWRAGLRISQAFALADADLDPRRGTVLVRLARAVDVARAASTTGRGSTCVPG